MSYSNMNTGSGLIHQYLGEAFPKLLQLYERLPEIMEVYDSIHNSITSNFNLQTQAYVYNIVGSEFIYSPFIVGTTSESSLVYSLTADRNAAAWTIDPATGVIAKTMDTADTGTTVLTITVVDSSINETRTSTINIVTFKDVSSIQDPLEITLNGDQYMEVNKDGIFLDPGVTYNVATETVGKTGSVDTSTPGTYVINYTATSQGITAKATRVVNVINTAEVSATRAKLTLIGDNPEYVNYGAVWGDSGVTAVEATNVVTTGSVDSQVEGAHVITYAATSSSGDVVSIDRVVFVQPKYQSQVVVPKAQLVTTAIDTAASITLINQGLNDTKFIEIVEPPTHGDITSTTIAGAVYTPVSGYTGTDYFTYKATTEDGSNEGIGTIFLTVGLGAANSQINLLLNAPVASKIIEVASGTNIYSINKSTVSNMAISGFGVDSVSTPTTSDSTVTAIVSEATTRYTLEWDKDFTGVVQLPVKFTDGSQSYITNVVLDVQKVPGLEVTNNPLDQILTVPFIEMEGDESSSNFNESFDILPDNPDIEIVEVLSSGNIGTPTRSGPRSVSYSMPNEDFNVTESFLVRMAYLPISGLTQLRNVTMVFTAFAQSAVVAKDLTLIAPFNTDTVISPTLPTGVNITGVTSAAHGTASVTNNQIKYIPDNGYTGGDTFNYVMSNGAEGIVSVYVRDYDGQFKINNFFQPCNYQTLVNFDPFVNDIATNPVFVTSSPAANGTVSKSGTVFTYVPNASFVGSDSFTYTMQNSEKPSLNDTATVWIEVLPDGAALVTPPGSNTPPVITLLGDNPETVTANTQINLENFTAGSTSNAISGTGTADDGKMYRSIIFTSDDVTINNDDSRFSTIQLDATGLDSVSLHFPTSITVCEYEIRTSSTVSTDYSASGWLINPNGVMDIDLTDPAYDNTVYIALWFKETDLAALQVGPVYLPYGGSGETYVDPGATATDNEDGDLTSSIVVGGDTVDTTTVGVYNKTYTATDLGGLTTTVSRTINVIAAVNTPPTITLVGDSNTGIYKTEESEIIIPSTTTGTWTDNTFLHLGDAGSVFEISIPIQTQALLIGAAPTGTDYTSTMGGKYLINGQNTDYAYDGNAFGTAQHINPPGTWGMSYCRTGLRRDSSGYMEFFVKAPDGTENVVALGNNNNQLDFVVWDHMSNTGRDTKGLRLNGVLVDSTVIGNAQTSDASDYDLSNVPTIAGTVPEYALLPLTGDTGTTITNTKIGEDGTLMSGSLDSNGAPIFNNSAYIDFTNLRIPNSDYTIKATFNMSGIPTDSYPGFNQVIIASRSVGDYGFMLVCSRSWANATHTILDVALTDPNITATVLYKNPIILFAGTEYTARLVDKNNILTVYLNDVVVKVVSYTGTFDNSRGLMISREPRASDYWFKGTIKDVIISGYADEGATATDTEDGDIQAISRTGEVDPTTPGSYTLVYNVTDPSGSTDSKTKTIFVA